MCGKKLSWIAPAAIAIQLLTGVPTHAGATIMVEIKHESGLIAFLGEVRWAKKVPANILHKLKGGMGVQIISFLSGEGLYHALCDELVEKWGD